VLPVRAELVSQLETLGGRMGRCLARGVDQRRLELRSASGRFPKLDVLLQGPRQKLDNASQRFGGALGRMINRKRAAFDRASGGLRPAALRRETSAKRAQANQLARRLGPAIGHKLKALRDALQSQSRVLDSVSYQRVLARGFALVTGPDGRLVRSSRVVSDGDVLSLRFSDGEVGAIAGKGAPTPATPPSSSDPQRPRIRRARRSDDQGSLF